MSWQVVETAEKLELQKRMEEKPKVMESIRFSADADCRQITSLIKRNAIILDKREKIQ